MKANGNGRIVHEMTTNGAVSNPGNTQETAQFILTVGRLFEWTGDLGLCKGDVPGDDDGPPLAADATWTRTRTCSPKGTGSWRSPA